MKRGTRFLFTVWIMLAGMENAGAQQYPIFPNPLHVTTFPRTYELRDTIRYAMDPPFSDVVQAVAANYRKLHQLEFVPVDSRANLVCLRSSDLKPEAYQLSVTDDGILIQYADRNGLLYGLQSLDQWMQQQRGTISLPEVEIKDEPRFSYRGVHLDCSRHFYSLEELKGFIDQIAALKFNRFHWHLTDDQGWRLEIKQFPLLTEIGAWRDSTIVGHYSREPRSYDKTIHGGFYTQEEAKELVRYAARLGITVVPEIELPGHARAALAAYPELGCTGEKMPVPGVWGVFDDVFCTKPETIDFLKKVLDEVVAIFPSETIHIGGDEVPKVRWDVCPRCQAVKTEYGLADSHELQSYVIREMEAHLRSYGRKLMGWDEILEGGLADNAQVMSWRGMEGGIAAAKAHHPVVMTPTTWCYFDYYQSGHPDEPLAIGGFLPLEKVYGFNPVPEGLTAEEQRYILGGQANLWTEYLSSMRDVQYNAFPRLIAMAQVLWCKAPPAYYEFAESMLTNYLWRLDQWQVNYSRSFLDPRFEPFAKENGIGYKITMPVKGLSVMMDYQAISDFSIQPTVVPQSFNLELNAFRGSTFIRKFSVPVTTHRFIGKPVVFQTPPHPKYNHHGKLGLTNGVKGKRPWRGDQWLGFLSDTVQFTIDLGAVEKWESIELGCLNDPGSWIYQPLWIGVAISNDGIKYKEISNENITSELITINKKAKGRYVRITLINQGLIPAGHEGAGTTPWTFIDELIFR